MRPPSAISTLARPCWVTAIIFCLASVANAQTPADPGAPAQPVSWAQMFLYTPGSVFGSAMIWFLLLMSVATVALIIHFLMQNRRSVILPPGRAMDIEQLLMDKKFRDAIELTQRDPSVFGRIMYAALADAKNGYGAMERAIEEAGDLAGTQRVRALEWLNVFGAVGPMIGLFGTVYGMIVAFQVIVAKGGTPSPGELAGGISTALVTTFWGLIVGIPAVAAAALIRNHIDALVTEAMMEAEAVIGRFQPKPAHASPSPRPRPAESDKSD